MYLHSFKQLVALSALVALIAFPAQALGQATTGEAYTEDDISTLNRENSSGTPGDPVDPATGSSHQTATDSGGSLPFTGLDIVLIAVAGVLLATVGFGMRRLTRAPDTA